MSSSTFPACLSRRSHFFTDSGHACRYLPGSLLISGKYIPQFSEKQNCQGDFPLTFFWLTVSPGSSCLKATGKTRRTGPRRCPSGPDPASPEAGPAAPRTVPLSAPPSTQRAPAEDDPVPRSGLRPPQAPPAAADATAGDTRPRETAALAAATLRARAHNTAKPAPPGWAHRSAACVPTAPAAFDCGATLKKVCFSEKRRRR